MPIEDACSKYEVKEFSVSPEVPHRKPSSSRKYLKILSDGWAELPAYIVWDYRSEDTGLFDHYFDPDDVNESISVGSDEYFYVSTEKDAGFIFAEKIRAYESKQLEKIKDEMVRQANRFDFVMNETQKFIKPSPK